MSEEKKNGQISRREFLKDAGLVVGGATIGSLALVNACNNTGATETVTTTAAGATSTKTVTTTVSGAGSTSTVTVTAPPVTVPAAQVATDTYTLNVNGVDYKLQLQPHWNLAFVLRDRLGLFGTKIGCEMGQCASCTVLQDGVPVLACLVLAVEAQGKKYTTIEGLSEKSDHPVQKAWMELDVPQCGFCQSGQLMSAAALIASTPSPTDQQIDDAMAGNICRCGTYQRIRAAIHRAAAFKKEGA
jgi:isoquinoline 1-oxidoreductase alpha subunit